MLRTDSRVGYLADQHVSSDVLSQQIITASVLPITMLNYRPDTARRRLRRQDPVMAELMRRVGPFRLKTEAALTPFESLVRAIVYQQLSGRSAAAIHARVCALFRGRMTAAKVLAQPDSALRDAGLSAAKLRAVKDLADKQQRGVVPTFCEMQSLPDDEIIARVTEVRGIGRWTVEMLLIHRLGRADVLPVDDFGIRQGYRLAYGLEEAPTPRVLAAIGESQWAPYRSVAAWYLWRATDSVDWAAARDTDTSAWQA